MSDEWDDILCPDQSFHVLLVINFQSGEEVETGAIYPSLVDQRAGSERLFVVVKVVNDRINQFLRQLPGTVFLSVTTLLKVIETHTVQRPGCGPLQRALVCSWTIPPEKETVTQSLALSHGDGIQQILRPRACTRSPIPCLDRISGL